MVGGWRRAFCTTIGGKDREHKELKQRINGDDDDDDNDRACNNNHLSKSRFGFFSNPSTPRLQSQKQREQQQQQQQPVSVSNLRCKTTLPALLDSTASAPKSPRLHVKTAKNSPRFFFRSNPSSPKSPSSFSLLKSSLRLSKNRCGICLQSVKTGQGTAIFTAECAHGFHFPCIAAHVRKQGGLVCPVCSAQWKELPLLALRPQNTNTKPDPPKSSPQLNKIDDQFNNQKRDLSPLKNLKVYNDDEPLMSPTASSGFVPIPESDENEDGEDEVHEFQGFFVNDGSNCSTPTSSLLKSSHHNVTGMRNIAVKLSSESAIVSVNRSYESYTVVLKLKAPPAMQNHAPIDLVTVIDVSGKMSGEKQKSMKRSMRIVISSLSSNDRLSIVAFSATSKRLFPLRRMTANGKRSARRIIDALGCIGEDSCAADAVKKATKVLEDRREKNSVSSILLLSDCRENSSISHGRIDNVPVHTFHFDECRDSAQIDDDFSKVFATLLSATVQDLRVELGFVTGSAQSQISAIYKCKPDPPSVVEPGLIRFNELYADDERELLLELKVPTSASGSHHHVLTIQSCYRDPSLQKIVYSNEQALLIPRPQSARSSNPSIQRLRYQFVAIRASAEARRLIERNDLSGAHTMLSSARALLVQADSGLAYEYVCSLERELAELNSQRLHQVQVQRRRTATTAETAAARKESSVFVDEKGEPLTPTSAWRAAERLAKVAIMRKSLNRVSDLHGFENARF